MHVVVRLASGSAGVHRHHGKTSRLRDTWVLRKHELATARIIYVAFSAAWFAVGWLLTHPLKDSFIVHRR